MFRKQFIDVVTSTGMATLKQLRPLTMDRNETEISEFNLLSFPNFDEVSFGKLIAQKYKVNFIDLKNARIADEVLSIMPKKLILKYRAIPIQKTGQKIILAIFDPTIASQIQELTLLLKMQVEMVVTTISAWKRLFEGVRQSVDELLDSVEEVHPESAKDTDFKVDDIGHDVVVVVNKLLVEAFILKASDIHIEVYEKKFRIRMRVDGKLREVSTPSKDYALAIISRMKIMAKMDIAEKRLPQDGRIKLKISGKPIDFRVSSLPTLYGEKIVMRLLDQSNLNVDLQVLGFEKKQMDDFLQGIKKPFGMCLVTGPTGSGKSTTLYSALSELNEPGKNISTAEDPVEFNLEGINQVNVKKDIGLTFASSLKAFLRQDPDIIMVGEIRDLEVGEIALEAALTGHLVLSTLHTNDAASTIQRLINMGLEPFLLVAALNVIIAQRLCRKICTHCKKPQNVPIEQLVRVGFTESTAQKIKVYKGEGCQACNGTGYKQRVAIYEVMPITSNLKELIIEGASADKIKWAAIKEGMKTLRMSALTKVALGETTIEEAIANSASDK